MSSDINMGITRNNSDGTSFSLKLGITPISVSGGNADGAAIDFPSNDKLNYFTGDGFTADRVYFDTYSLGVAPKQYETLPAQQALLQIILQRCQALRNFKLT